MTGTKVERTAAEKKTTANKIGATSPDIITCGRIVQLVQRVQKGTLVMTEEGRHDEKSTFKKEAGQAVVIKVTMEESTARTLLNWWQTLVTIIGQATKNTNEKS